MSKDTTKQKAASALPEQVSTESLRAAIVTADIDQLAELERMAQHIGCAPDGLTMQAVAQRRAALHSTRG